eukprot:TRINITY_DN3519_c0_g1_i2.p1 TRINITY_DN3519_c0_g1~~TRINITY_DN3519_c0_g1_i2.p1  ORF type:complete len:580 (-),score=123.65 TRINITY_DN3519_c0_g1_i2:878-2617(-)
MNRETEEKPRAESGVTRCDGEWTEDPIALARKVLESEAATLLRVSASLDDSFRAAIRVLEEASHAQGHVVVMGIGKSGHVGRKIAATLASTGTPAFFIHATEAAHGDLGMLTSRDVVVALSYSGRTDEVLAVIGPLRLIGARIVAITGMPDSPLARAADVALCIGPTREADPHNLAPTNTSTATLALGDAIAVTLSVRKRFTRMQFGKFHPGGALGRQVLGAQYPKFAMHNQQHLFRFLDTLTTKEKESFERDLENIKLEELGSIWQSVTQGIGKEIPVHELEPIKDIPSVQSLSKEQKDTWTKIGFNAIAAGKVAVVVFAGGQYWRMGAAMSIGMLDIGLPSHKSLFQLQMERVVKLKELCRKMYPQAPEIRIPVFVMTSADMLLSVTDLLENNDYFGLPARHVEVFAQRNLPCVDLDGKILLESPCKVASAPDGHGGLYTAIQDAQVLDKMDQLGTEYVFVYAVDNALVRVADPLYLGYCIDSAAEFGYKVVNRADPLEPAGVVCKRNGKIDYVEHSELPRACAEQDENGELTFNAANILNLFYTKSFLSQVVRNYKPKSASVVFPFISSLDILLLC